MITINCKLCGCPNQVQEDQTTCTCEACGGVQTIPKLDDEKKANLFNKANAARIKCDFYKSMSYYEQILIDYPEEAEAHFGLCLSRYGIEYVDDPKTNKKIPTCHRTLYNSIFEDVDYKDAIKYADVVAKRLYQSEAEVIDKIQKSIIAISQKETPYDIFICYKETTEDNHRTRDSYVAEDIYSELTKKGYKVFFSRITLESKLGLQYEPIIFSALQTSKIMLVIASKPEYFNAVWVKNEWSRYLQFMEEQKGNKYMIPCFRDMEAYDMPEEFLPLQSQNLDKLGAKQDLLRAIDKIFGKDTFKEINKQTSNMPSKVTNLLNRAKLMLEDKEIAKADELVETVLNENIECSEAYVLKILIKYKLTNEEDLAFLEKPLDNDRNYQKAIRFASDEYRNRIEGYNNVIKDRINVKNKKYLQNRLLISLKEILNRKENAEQQYQKGITTFENKAYYEALNIFNNISYYKDSSQYINKCNININDSIYNNAIALMKEENFNDAIKTFQKIINYKDAKQKITECDNLQIQKEYELIYTTNIEKLKSATSVQRLNQFKYKEAINKLNEIIDYKDTKEVIVKYQNAYQESCNTIEKIKKSRKRKKRIAWLIALLLLIVIGLISYFYLIPEYKYHKAISTLNELNLNKYSSPFKEYEFKNHTKDEVRELLEATKNVEAQRYAKALKESNVFEDIYRLKENDYFNLSIFDRLLYYFGKINVTIKDSSFSSNMNIDITNIEQIDENIKNINEILIPLGKSFLNYKFSSIEFSTKDPFVKLNLEINTEWTQYKIGYELNGGDFVYSNTLSYSLYVGDIEFENPKRVGYDFTGWTYKYKDVIVSTPKTDLIFTSNELANIASDITLIANWKGKDINLTLTVCQSTCTKMCP